MCMTSMDFYNFFSLMHSENWNFILPSNLLIIFLTSDLLCSCCHDLFPLFNDPHAPIIALLLIWLIYYLSSWSWFCWAADMLMSFDYLRVAVDLSSNLTFMSCTDADSSILTENLTEVTICLNLKSTGNKIWKKSSMTICKMFKARDSNLVINLKKI